MLVMSMNSKRQRRPSVRLREVGDVPAASACWFSQSTRESLFHRNWDSEFIPDPEFPNCPHNGNVLPGFTSSTDTPHSIESNDPKSSKSNFDHTNSSKSNFDHVDSSKSDFVHADNGPFNGNVLPGFTSSTDTHHSIEDRNPNSSRSNFDHTNSSRSNSDHANSSRLDFDYEFGTITWKTRRPRGRRLACVRGALTTLPFDSVQSPEFEFSGKESFGIPRDRDTNGVRRWLEDRGFGDYGDVFEMHEVDEEALPLLTLSDLKEMGVFAVGQRRKLFEAIRQLRCGS